MVILRLSDRFKVDITDESVADEVDNGVEKALGLAVTYAELLTHYFIIGVRNY